MDESVTFVYHEDCSFAWIVKNGAIVHKTEITLDYLDLIDGEIENLMFNIMDTYDLEYQIECSRKLTEMLKLKQNLL